LDQDRRRAIPSISMPSWRTAKEVRTLVLDDDAPFVPLVIPRQERPDAELEAKAVTLGVALPPSIGTAKSPAAPGAETPQPQCQYPPDDVVTDRSVRLLSCPRSERGRRGIQTGPPGRARG
jgi:hypothetical protein